MADNKIQVYMYHHTHWDREWWTTFQNFRFRLVHIVDQLLDILDADPSFSFTLDGQTIVLKDYLEVRPENEERLLGYIRAGRLGIGPWHILPDEYLVSGEAHIRNLWLGERTARQYGVVNNKVGYLPDQFGHISQMPQILAGFGIDAAVVWRGFGAPPVGQPEGEGDVGGPNYYAFPPARNPKQFPERTQSEFWWEAPDGTRVMGVYLPLEYYQSHFADFPGDSERTYDQTVGRCRRTANYLRAYATTDNVLQPYGGDHLPADPRLPELLQTINRELEGDNIEIKLALLGDFVRAVQAENPDLQVVWKGEGRAFGRKAYVLPGVASTRIYIKQLNRDNQVALERYAEPYQALRWMLGGKYEHNYLWLAWERLIQNHPHDSISGCSIDQVHREMITRFDESKQLADLLAFSAQEDIAGRVNMGNLPEGAQPIVVFNPLNWSRTDEVRINLNPYFEISPNWWVLRDAAGNEVPFQAQDAEEPLRQFAAFYDWLPIKGPHKTGLTSNACTTVTFVAKDVPPLGYASYYLEKRTSRQPLHRVRNYTVDGDVAREKGAAETTGLRIGPGLLENEYLQVTVDATNGSLTILDKATGHTYCGLNQFRDGGDAGDTYNYSWPMGDQVLTTACVQPRLTWVEYGPIKATLRVTWPWSLPESLTADRESRSPSYVPVELHSDITLYPGVKRVDVKTHFNNRAKDHRLQALFPFGGFVCRSHAEGQFDVVSRPTRLPENERGSSEPAVYEVPQQTFISVSDGVRGLTIANKGLPEAAVYDDAQGTVAITLLRAVGWVSREDFLARTGGAGPTSPTPDAQMLGEVVAEYAIVPHGGTWNDAKSYRQAHDFNAPLAAVPTKVQSLPMRHDQPYRTFEKDLPASGSLIDVSGDLLLTALKRAEDKDALIVRFVNESALNGTATVRPLRKPTNAYLVNLKEEQVGELEVAGDGSVAIAARPWQIVSVAFEF